MKIFFISYWGATDGLSISTVIPNLRLLSQMDKVTQIDYFTVERDGDKYFKDSQPSIAKVIHHPIFSIDKGFFLWTKIADWQRIRKTIIDKATEIKPDLVICRGAMAGAFGTLLNKMFNIPYIVESFEPHADYMKDSGVWKSYGLRYQFQVSKEKEIKEKAAHLITVSHNYLLHLNKNEGINKEKLTMVPCVVDADKFKFNAEKRQEVRKKLGLKDYTITGVYLGKFGSIYYDNEAFTLFKQTLDFFNGDFFLILLTPTNPEEIYNKLAQVGFPQEKALVTAVPHAEVPNYLSAADFAFSTIKPAPCRQFCSPIKNGEYWANGLPILTPDGIGDDSDIVKAEGGGAIIDVNNKESVQNGLQTMLNLIKTENYRHTIKELALKHRHPNIGKAAYERLISKY